MYTGGAIAGYGEANISACAGDVCGKKQFCSRAKEIALMTKYLKDKGIPVPGTDTGVVKAVMKHLEVDTELDIYKSIYFKWVIGFKAADRIITDIFKPFGPASSTKLLNNFNIENAIHGWTQNTDAFKFKRILHVPFQMIDFMSQKTELAKMKPHKERENFDCFCCVLNTDYSYGGGKHWFALFGDFTPAGTEDAPLTLEYFNSSGFPPMVQLQDWIETTVHKHKIKYNVHIKYIRALSKQIQYSRTECGVWSCVFILTRLLGHPPNWLESTDASDSDITQYRKHLFLE